MYHYRRGRFNKKIVELCGLSYMAREHGSVLGYCSDKQKLIAWEAARISVRPAWPDKIH
jgi:hypothetical protein